MAVTDKKKKQIVDKAVRNTMKNHQTEPSVIFELSYHNEIETKEVLNIFGENQFLVFDFKAKILPFSLYLAL